MSTATDRTQRNGHAREQSTSQPIEADHAERSLLGCLLLDSTRFNAVHKLVETDDFRVYWHAMVYRAIEQAVAERTAVDISLLAEQLKSSEPPDGVTWLSSLSSLLEVIPHAEHAARFAVSVRTAANRRRLVAKLQAGLEAVQFSDGDVGEIAAEVAGELDQIVRSTPGKPNSDIDLICLADVERQPIHWLWPGRIALGKLTMVTGNPGLGKSCVTIDLAARVTRARPWPDNPSTLAPEGSVIFLADEDDLGDTIGPRLDAASADTSKVFSIKATRRTGPNGKTEGWIDLSRDISAIEATIRQHRNVRLVVVDPISAYLGKTKSHDNGEVRGVLGPLAEMAGRLSVAMVLVNHLNKGQGDALSRSMGSVGFVASCRAVFAVARDKDDETGMNRLFLPVKNNIGNDRSGLSFRLINQASNQEQPCIAWGSEPITTTADEALAPDTNDRGRKPRDRTKAEEFLRTALGEGPRAGKEVEDEAQGGHDISRRTLERARAALGVVSFRSEPGKGPWLWRLPTEEKATPPI